MTALRFETADGTTREGEVGQTVRDVLGDGLPADALAAAVAGELVDLDQPLDAGGLIEVIGPGARRVAALVRATAIHVLQLALFLRHDAVEVGAVGHTGDGLWVDLDVTETLHPDQFAELEHDVARIIASDQPLERLWLTREQAAAELRRQRSRLRAEMLAEDPRELLPFVRLGEITEPAAGPLLRSTGQLGAFKLLSVSGAYFKGDETRPMLQRLWAAAFATPDELATFLTRRAAAKKRDHRKLGPRLGLFGFVPEAPAHPFWRPRGVTLLQTVFGYLRRAYRAAGYAEIRTPELLPESLWRTSGHWEHYHERMFVTASEDEQLAVRPMNCPGALLTYKMAERSYRELPLRLMEMGRVHRNELSGTLHGLLRLREFTQDDAHVFVSEEQLEDELVRILELLQSVYYDFGFDAYRVELSTRPAGAIGSEDAWRQGERALLGALARVGIAHDEDRGEGAFYGPKIDVHIADCLGREWQCGTIQVDFVNPERFDLTYAAPAGRPRRPVLIHRAILGSLERFIGVLIEHTAGELPLWLAPVQARLLPISEERHGPAVLERAARLEAAGIRVDVDLRPRTLDAHIRHAEGEHIPFILVIGDDELEHDEVSVRQHGAGELGRVALDELISSYDWFGPLAARGGAAQ